MLHDNATSVGRFGKIKQRNLQQKGRLLILHTSKETLFSLFYLKCFSTFAITPYYRIDSLCPTSEISTHKRPQRTRMASICVNIWGGLQIPRFTCGKNISHKQYTQFQASVQNISYFGPKWSKYISYFRPKRLKNHFLHNRIYKLTVMFLKWVLSYIVEIH